jgi:hypothetical protein
MNKVRMPELKASRHCLRRTYYKTLIQQEKQLQCITRQGRCNISENCNVLST